MLHFCSLPTTTHTRIINMKMDKPKGLRRADAWWEPTFNPSLHGNLTPSDWNFSNNTGPKKAFLDAALISNIATDGEVLKLDNLTFEQCDLQGHFEHRPNITFSDCRFIECDFSLSDWYRTTFKNCVFDKCSFALATFEECEFRDCRWDKIGMQGSKTDFIRTFITNPESFIRSAFSGTNAKRKDKIKHCFEQKMRLERTKAQVTRTVMQSHREVGDDDTFFQSAKIHDLQQVKSTLYDVVYSFIFRTGVKSKLKIFGLLPLFFEFLILSIFGYCNDWGARLSKPLFLILICFTVFGFAYPIIDGNFDLSFAAEKSFNISILAGYGNSISSQDSQFMKIATFIHILLAILFYTIFFSTAISRNSRSR